MTDRKKPGVAFWATVVVVAVLAAYVGPYAYAVDRGPLLRSGPHVRGAIMDWPASYGWGCPFGRSLFIENQDVFRRVFAPVHALDRKLRPTYWRTVVRGP
jgi:hypothetical protein